MTASISPRTPWSMSFMCGGHPPEVPPLLACRSDFCSARRSEMPPPRLQHLLHLGAEARRGEGFHQELDAGIEPALMDDGIARIPRGEQHLDIRSAPPRLVGELAPIEPARQSDIGEEQRDFRLGIEQMQ